MRKEHWKTGKLKNFYCSFINRRGTEPVNSTLKLMLFYKVLIKQTSSDQQHLTCFPCPSNAPEGPPRCDAKGIHQVEAAQEKKVPHLEIQTRNVLNSHFVIFTSTFSIFRFCVSKLVRSSEI